MTRHVLSSSRTAGTLLLALFATSALYAGFSGAALAASTAVRTMDEQEPTIEINLNALDTLNRHEFPMNNGFVPSEHGWHKGPEGKKPAHKAAPKKHKKPAKPKLKPVAAAPKPVAPQPEKPAPAAEKPAAPVVIEQPQPVVTPPPPPAPAAQPPAPPPAPAAAVEDKEIKAAAGPVPELNPVAPPPPVQAPAVELPTLPDAKPAAADVAVTPMAPPPTANGDFSNNLAAPAATPEPAKEPAPKPAEKPAEAPAAPTPPPPPPAPTPDANAKPADSTPGLPSLSMLMGGKAATTPDAAPAPAATPAPAAETLPSPQTLMDKLDTTDAKKEPSKTDEIGTKAFDASQAPTLRVVFLSTETSVPLSVKPDLDKIAKRLKDSGERVSLVAYASGAGDQATTARRVSLSRALSVRAYLIDQGINYLHIDVHAEGDKNAGTNPDRVDMYVSANK